MTNHRYHVLYIFNVSESTNLGSWSYIREQMKAHGTEESLYASEFVFDKVIGFEVQDDGLTALYVEIATKRNKDTWDMCLSKFLDASTTVNKTDEKVVPINYDADTIKVPVSIDNGDITIFHFAAKHVLVETKAKAELGLLEKN